MPTTEARRLDDMMRKIEGLLATADSINDTNPEMAANYRANAERIMRKYKVEQEDLIKRGDLKVDGLNVMFKNVRVARWDSPFMDVYVALISYAVWHTGCEAVWAGTEDNERVLTIIGYEADIRYTEALYMNARLVFADRMEPKPDPSLSDEDNVYRLRNAGMERARVGIAMGWGGEGTKGPGKVTRLYKRACAARGEDAVLTGKGLDVKVFRETYGEHFRNEFYNRLSAARIAVENEDGGLVLHGRKERIKEAMYQRWPNLRPKVASGEVAVPRVKTKAEERAEQRMWDRMYKDSLKKAERERSVAGQAGKAAGRKAAQEININTGTPTKRLTD